MVESARKALYTGHIGDGKMLACDRTLTWVEPVNQLQTETIIIMDQYAYILMTATQIPLIVTKVRLVWREDVVASYMAERSITLTEMIM